MLEAGDIPLKPIRSAARHKSDTARINEVPLSTGQQTLSPGKRINSNDSTIKQINALRVDRVGIDHYDLAVRSHRNPQRPDQVPAYCHCGLCAGGQTHANNPADTKVSIRRRDIGHINVSAVDRNSYWTLKQAIFGNELLSAGL